MRLNAETWFVFTFLEIPSTSCSGLSFLKLDPCYAEGILSSSLILVWSHKDIDEGVQGETFIFEKGHCSFQDKKPNIIDHRAKHLSAVLPEPCAMVLMYFCDSLLSKVEIFKRW